MQTKRLYAASTAMNVVLAQGAAEIAGVEPGQMFRQTPHRAVGELLHAVDEPRYTGDRLVTDAWAEELGLPSVRRSAPACKARNNESESVGRLRIVSPNGQDRRPALEPRP